MFTVASPEKRDGLSRLGPIWRSLLASLATVVFLIAVVVVPAELRSLRGPAEYGITQCCVIPERQLAISVTRCVPPSATQPVRYHLAFHELANNWRTRFEASMAPSAIAVAGRTGQLFIGSWNRKVYRLDLDDPLARPAELFRCSRAAYGLVCSADEMTLVAAEDRQVTAWSLDASVLAWQRELSVAAMVAIPQAPSVLCGTDDGQLLQLDLRSGVTMRSLALGEAIRSLALSPDGRF